MKLLTAIAVLFVLQHQIKGYRSQIVPQDSPLPPNNDAWSRRANLRRSNPLDTVAEEISKIQDLFSRRGQKILPEEALRWMWILVKQRSGDLNPNQGDEKPIPFRINPCAASRYGDYDC